MVEKQRQLTNRIATTNYDCSFKQFMNQTYFTSFGVDLFKINR